MKAIVCGNFPAGNSMVTGAKSKAAAKAPHHINETEITVWVMIVIIFLATIAAGYMFCLKAGL